MFVKSTHFKQVCQLLLSLIVGADWCNLVQFGVTSCSLVQLGGVWSNLVEFSANWCYLLPYVQIGAVWSNLGSW